MTRRNSIYFHFSIQMRIVVQLVEKNDAPIHSLLHSLLLLLLLLLLLAAAVPLLVLLTLFVIKKHKVSLIITLVLGE